MHTPAIAGLILLSVLASGCSSFAHSTKAQELNIKDYESIDAHYNYQSYERTDWNQGS